MPEHEVNDLEDPRLEPYLHLRNRNWIAQSGRFIAEGSLLVKRLLASDYPCESVLVDRKYVEQLRPIVPAEVDMLLVDHQLVSQIVGFNFHRGIIGCGRREHLLTLHEHFGAAPEPSETLVALVGVQDPENVGGMLRSCAGLGIRRVVIGAGTADPLSRRALRVSMGTSLRLQLFRSADTAEDLAWLRREMSVEILSTSLASGSVPLERIQRAGPVLVLFGNERRGVPEEIQQMSDRQVRINMELGTDSLNVCVAAGIVMHYLCRLATGPVDQRH